MTLFWPGTAASIDHAVVVWTSLEVARLVVGILTPVAVVILGVFVARATARIEQTQWASQKVVAPKLNRLIRNDLSENNLSGHGT